MIRGFLFSEGIFRSLGDKKQGIIVGNKAKERISKRVFQEKKARQIFKYAVSIRGYEMFVFRKVWRALFSWHTRFEIPSKAILTLQLLHLCLEIEDLDRK